ncbi:MAG: carbamoyltransferase HypF [Armatimonadota bacterium]
MTKDISLSKESNTEPDFQRLRVVIHGAVQGVGFRPFVYRLATALGLTGWVINNAQGVFIEVEGPHPSLASFLLRIEREKPPRSFIQSLESSFLDRVSFNTFEIRHSEEAGAKSALILPDIATCPDCLRDICDPGNRRFRYPFTNCTNCGPRFSIIEALPYDRPNTTMRQFAMCEHCWAEYENPLDRRFHAQPNACPVCGPHVELWQADGAVLATHDDALQEAVAAIHRGEIVAVKGIGGFHLLVDAANEDAVYRLRERKHREEKPLALMCPTLGHARTLCEVSEIEERLLLSPEAPIVLLHRRADNHMTPSLAPHNPYLGIMLPYSPLHHLLLSDLDIPVVATSGNLSDEPICTDEQEALTRLREIADVFLVHNRPITRHVDDSIVRVMMDREMVQRRARGYAPLPIHVQEPLPTLLAVGAHLKNTIAASVGQDVFVSQHIGDLETAQAFDAFQRVIGDFNTMYALKPEQVACDAHPDYLSSQFARSYAPAVHAVQHHYAHVLACMAENELEPLVLGISWDGTGYGLDGTIWGGEFLLVDETSFTRSAHLRTFTLPGGDKAVREPCRSALGVLYAIFGDELFTMTDLAPMRAFTTQELVVLQTILLRKINAPITSSAGRLFDAVAAIAGLRQHVRFEGQAAMELEFAIEGMTTDDAYELTIVDSDDPYQPLIIDWEPMIRVVLEETQGGVPLGMRAAKFHNALVEAMVAVARHVGVEQVALSGGGFQNRYLTERAITRLREAGFRPYWHQRIPPNDGGIALGQIIAAARRQGK